MNKNDATWSAFGALAGVLISAVGGSWYVSSAIAEQSTRARETAKGLVQEHQDRIADVYARREDLKVLETKLDAVLQIQAEILVHVRERARPRE